MASPTIDYDALAKKHGAVSSTPAGSSPVDYDALAKKHGAISSTAAPSLLQDIGTSFQNFGRDVGSAIYGASATANRMTANLAQGAENLLEKYAGLPQGTPLRDLGQWARNQQQAQQAEAQRLAGGRNDLASQINRGLTQGVLELPQYAVAAHVAGPVAGMAAIGAITEGDKGWQAALEAAASGAATGGALHVMGPASRAVRLTGAAAMTYAQARLQGASHTDALAHATTMGLLSAQNPGGVTAREFVPGLDTAIKAGSAGGRAAAPDVAKGTGNALLAYGLSYLPIPEGMKAGLGFTTAAQGARQIGRGVRKGYQAARASMAETAPAEAAPVGERPAAAPPEPQPPGDSGITPDDVLLLRFIGAQDPLNADAEMIGMARQLGAENPELLNRLRSGAPEPPPEAPVTPEEAAAPPVTSLGTLEYTAPAAPIPNKLGTAPAETPPPPPAEPPVAAPTPAAGRPAAAEIAAQLEASTRPDRMLDFLRRMDPEITADALDSIAPHEWGMVAEGAGSPRGTAPTAEDIATIRENLGGIKAQEPAAAAAEFATKRTARTSRRKAAVPPVAEPDLEGQLAESLAAVEQGQRPVAQIAEEGPAKPTASEGRVETIAQHLAGIHDFNLDYLNDIAEDPEALGVLDTLGRQLKVRGPQSMTEVQQIVDRVRQLRESEGPAAPAAGEPPPTAPPSPARAFVDRLAEKVAQFTADEEGAAPSRRGTPMSLAELMGRGEKVLGGEEAPRTLKLKATGAGGSLMTSDLGHALEKSMDSRYRLDQDTSPARRRARALESMTEDLRYALAEDDNGRGWYTDDVAEMERMLTEARPEFKNPHTMGLFKYLLGITSNGVDPELNFDAALRGWDLYKRDGRFSAYDKDRPSEYGNPEGTGLTFRANSYRGAMRRLSALVADKGEAGAVEWLRTKHPVSELHEYYPDVPVGSNEPRYGSYIFGEKVGSFGSNLNGIHTELTADKWWSRTWNRWMGTMMDTDQNGNIKLDKKTGKPLLQDDPRNETERNLMRETAAKVAGVLGLEVDELQAVLWYTEQKLYRKYGIAAQSASYADAAKKRLGKVQRAEDGVDRGSPEARGPDANSGKTGRGPETVPQRVSGRSSPGPRKEVSRRSKTLKELMQPE
jgi:hypothetical protein